MNFLYVSIGLLVIVIASAIIIQIYNNLGTRRQILSVAESLAIFVTTLSLGMFGYNIYSAYDIKETKKELEIISEEYKKSLDSLNFLKNMAENPNELNKILGIKNNNLFIVTNEIKNEIRNLLGTFSYLHIASALLSTESDYTDKSYFAWSNAFDVNPEVPLVRFGLAIQYYKKALNEEKLQNNKYSDNALKFFMKSYNLLSDEELFKFSLARYYYAIVSIIYISNIEKIHSLSSDKTREKKYSLAFKAVEVLKNLSSKGHKVGAVEYNEYLLYKTLASNTLSIAEYEKYKSIAEEKYNKTMNTEEYRVKLRNIPPEKIFNSFISTQ